MKESNAAVWQKDKERWTTRSPGFVSAVLVAITAAVTYGIAICTPPISGPLVPGGIPYPYSDIASRFPRDYYWMIPAIVLMLIFVVLMICIEAQASGNKKLYGRIAAAFACLAAAILAVDYFMQLSIIQPAVMNGETDGIAMWTQYNPHGAFIALEEFGYLVMTVALMFLAPVFTGKGVQKAIRWTGIISFAAAIGLFVVFSILFGVKREIYFELAVTTIGFTALVLLGIFAAVYFKKGVTENN